MSRLTMDVEDKIQKAMQEGKFDDLPGKGKPLRLDENSFEDPEWRLANHLLRSNGFTLPWIEMRQEIEAEVQDVRGRIQAARQSQEMALARRESPEAVEMERRRVWQVFRGKIEDLNRRIVLYNLTVPSIQFQLHLLKIEEELAGFIRPVDRSAPL